MSTLKDLCSEWGRSQPVDITRGAVFIPNWRPTSLNKLMGHWSRAHKAKKRDKEIIALCCRSIPKATTKRKIDIYIDLDKNQKRLDYDNTFKSLLDALVQCGVLKNDSPDWVQVGSVEYGRNYETPGTWILWKDLPMENERC